MITFLWTNQYERECVGLDHIRAQTARPQMPVDNKTRTKLARTIQARQHYIRFVYPSKVDAIKEWHLFALSQSHCRCWQDFDPEKILYTVYIRVAHKLLRGILLLRLCCASCAQKQNLAPRWSGNDNQVEITQSPKRLWPDHRLVSLRIVSSVKIRGMRTTDRSVTSPRTASMK